MRWEAISRRRSSRDVIWRFGVARAIKRGLHAITDARELPKPKFTAAVRDGFEAALTVDPPMLTARGASVQLRSVAAYPAVA
jgi:hypothetical protein